jgi:hypothetical protein
MAESKGGPACANNANFLRPIEAVRIIASKNEAANAVYVAEAVVACESQSSNQANLTLASG